MGHPKTAEIHYPFQVQSRRLFQGGYTSQLPFFSRPLSKPQIPNRKGGFKQARQKFIMNPQKRSYIPPFSTRKGKPSSLTEAGRKPEKCTKKMPGICQREKLRAIWKRWKEKKKMTQRIPKGAVHDRDVSENSGFSTQIIHFNRVFRYKPSILGYPNFWKHP